MRSHIRTAAAAFISAILIMGCSRDTALDLRSRFETLHAGDTVAQAREKLAQPLATPVKQWDALGFQYVEYRLIDAYSTYELVFAAVPTVEPALVSKSASAHSP